jgi:hypothetical protein
VQITRPIIVSTLTDIIGLKLGKVIIKAIAPIYAIIVDKSHYNNDSIVSERIRIKDLELDGNNNADYGIVLSSHRGAIYRVRASNCLIDGIVTTYKKRDNTLFANKPNDIIIRDIEGYNCGRSGFVNIGTTDGTLDRINVGMCGGSNLADQTTDAAVYFQEGAGWVINDVHTWGEADPTNSWQNKTNRYGLKIDDGYATRVSNILVENFDTQDVTATACAGIQIACGGHVEINNVDVTLLSKHNTTAKYRMIYLTERTGKTPLVNAKNIAAECAIATPSNVYAAALFFDNGRIDIQITFKNVTTDFEYGSSSSIKVNGVYYIYGASGTKPADFYLNGDIIKQISDNSIWVKTNVVRPLKVYKNSCPTSGTWTYGDFIENSDLTEQGTAGSKYIILGWKRRVTGSNNVLGTDWFECRVLTGN